ncbi:MAG: cyclase family protein [Saprospiraceae bacterium]|nr:cyclase family protein [Saprospiraceae bacterium]
MWKTDPIDLTMSVQNGQRGVQIDVAKTVESDGWNATTLHLYSHSGTHMDAPLHFGVSNQTIDEYPLSSLMGKAWVARIAGDCTSRWLQVKDLGGIAEKVEAGDSLLLQTGWSHRVAEESYRDALPRISDELATWCVERGVKILGVEPPSVANVNDLEELTRIHRILLAGGIVIVEGLCNLELIEGESVFFIALPLKIKGGDGAPVRAIAFEQQD